MELRFHHILGYLALGLTGSYGGVLALFLVHFYNANSFYPVVAKVTSVQFSAQVISTIFGCAAVVYLYFASVSQIKAILLPFFVTTYLLPFALFPFQEGIPSNTCSTKTSFSYFLISLGGFIALHHLCMTYKVAHECMSFRTMLVVAFGHPYQRAITIDLICCTVISFVFVVLELHTIDKMRFVVNYSDLKGLAWFLFILVATLGLSPGAVLLFLFAYREKNAFI